MVWPHVSAGRQRARWRRLRADRTLVRDAREYALAVVAGAGIQDDGLIEDVRLVVSEVVTNAMRAAERYAASRGRAWAPYEAPVSLRIECRPSWIHLLVTDPDPEMPDPEPRDLLDETGGRGLTIVDAVCDLWWVRPGSYGKTFHVVIARPGARITPDEAERLKTRDPVTVRRDLNESQCFAHCWAKVPVLPGRGPPSAG
jgi:anti-sigma regulatory factor (Ser/Thr protein kinase)